MYSFHTIIFYSFRYIHSTTESTILIPYQLPQFELQDHARSSSTSRLGSLCLNFGIIKESKLHLECCKYGVFFSPLKIKTFLLHTRSIQIFWYFSYWFSCFDKANYSVMVILLRTFLYWKTKRPKKKKIKKTKYKTHTYIVLKFC